MAAEILARRKHYGIGRADGLCESRRMAVNPIPADYPGVTPQLYGRNAADLIDFYKTAFGASELYRLKMPDAEVPVEEMQRQCDAMTAS